MKTILTTVAAILLASCTPKGTTVTLHSPDDFTLQKFFYADGEYVYIARHKECPHISTVTWKTSEGTAKHRHTVTHASVCIDTTK
ncbi:MAG: hypothetical protein K0S44_255 [Bacteroidetes bacterium]|jgi:hypothetical protein|nr:hypothetical protein [Bacteroidota bacterium]